MVAAFGFDERTVAAWLGRSGQHCQQGRVDVQDMQVDELWVKLVSRRV
jgi:hypothetical protein